MCGRIVGSAKEVVLRSSGTAKGVCWDVKG
jgi:hypothetical protein